MQSSEFTRSGNAQLVSSALNMMGRDTTVNHRHDIVLYGKKVSGSAFKISKGRAYHHGTMLLHSNLENLNRLLRSTRKGLRIMGIDSVRSSVQNLEIPHEEFVKSVCMQFQQHYGECQIVHVTEDEARTGDVHQIEKEFQTDNWLYGQTPAFTQNLEKSFSFGTVMVEVSSKHGDIIKVDIQGVPATFYVSASAMEAGLVGKKYGRGNFIQTDNEISQWIASEIL
ncbi:putative lipoate-protein ligase A [Neolecta irregularis DAH-3]|uniref:Putative lipoate-protein ligase A n=1 Tax=Neolecta irregularis (strain DAH-3) TaxID=1198029 RepID=A0A1U7LVW9_NEOID|nr:putative lipoate-protein ligase A [Neolecta irregularis DAH-3]|eukprot:OLL26768.1 putative lipoate-protein ligase A [Neolecta irregularis DAH-3]